jgi:hypothetical protein
MLPIPEIEAMVNHHVIHVYVILCYSGPLWVYWTYVFERFMSTLVRNISDRSRKLYTISVLYYTNCILCRPGSIDVYQLGTGNGTHTLLADNAYQPEGRTRTPRARHASLSS